MSRVQSLCTFQATKSLLHDLSNYAKKSKGLGAPVKSSPICPFILAFIDNNHCSFETLPSLDLGTLFHKKQSSVSISLKNQPFSRQFYNLMHSKIYLVSIENN